MLSLLLFEVNSAYRPSSQPFDIQVNPDLVVFLVILFLKSILLEIKSKW